MHGPADEYDARNERQVREVPAAGGKLYRYREVVFDAVTLQPGDPFDPGQAGRWRGTGGRRRTIHGWWTSLCTAFTRSSTVRTARKSSGDIFRPVSRRSRSIKSTASMLSISRSS